MMEFPCADCKNIVCDEGVTKCERYMDWCALKESRAKARWIQSGFSYKCSECGGRDDRAYIESPTIGKVLIAAYCRICGREMEEIEDEQ